MAPLVEAEESEFWPAVRATFSRRLTRRSTSTSTDLGGCGVTDHAVVPDAIRQVVAFVYDHFSISISVADS